MKSSVVVHACWFGAVVAAFACGKMLSGNDHNPENDPERASAKLANIAADNAAMGSPIALATGRSEAIDRPIGWSSADSRMPLTEEEIEELGIQFKNQRDPIQRRLAFARLLEGLTVENAKLIREQIAHLDSRSSELREFHYAWGAIGGLEAVLNGADTRERDMAATLAGWASADPEIALGWFNNHEKSDKFNSNELKMGLVHGLANTDTDTATSFVFQQAKGGDKQAEEMLGIVTRKILQATAPAEAADWASSLPAGKLRASAMDRVAHEYVQKDPKAAAAWAQQFAGEEHSARVIEEVGDEWAERDPVASVAWLESLEPSEGKSQGLGSALGEWVRKDPLAASQYLAKMPNSPERDSAISGFASRLAWEDPASAITWAEEIADTGTRNRTLVQTGQALFRRDAEAARLWLPSSGLSPEAQEKVLNPPRRR